jgi:hypothetical protein
VDDLRWVLARGLERGAHLLTAGERQVVHRVEGLSGPEASLYARLTMRVREVVRTEDAGDGWQALVEAGLADHVVPRRLQLAHMLKTDLAAACRAAGLSRAGRRADLIERLAGIQADDLGDGVWLRTRHRPLIRRLERWAFLRRRPDRSTRVVARLGHVRWPEYTVTSGAPLHADRRQLHRWEARLAALDELTAEEILAALDDPATAAPAGLSLRGSLTRRAMARARDLERADEPRRAADVYRQLRDNGHLPPGSVAVRLARTLEAVGDARGALDELLSAHTAASPANRVAIARSGRRVARSVGRGWVPERPLRAPRERILSIEGVEAAGPRPLYRVGGGAGPVEEAVAAVVATVGRRVVSGEGGQITTIFGLLFADTYFLPVDGALPVPFLSGPLDLGTPAFTANRPRAVEQVMDSVAGGHGPELMRRNGERYRDQAVAGISWPRLDDALDAAEALGGAGLRAVIGILLEDGLRSSRGLPDLLVLPGPVCRLAHGRPGRLGTGPMLVEVKGPGDAVRDEQAAWFHRLLEADVPVELWHVRRVAER